MDDQQKEKISNNPESDCWILRDSKTNPGHKYYYNPFTKQKLWRHSDEEIKKKESKAGNTLNNELNNAQTEQHLHSLKNHEDASTSDTKVMDKVQSMNHFKIWDVPIIPPTIPLIQQAFPILCNSLISPSNPIMQLGLQSSFNGMSHMHSISAYTPNFNTNNYPTFPVKTNSQQGSDKYSSTNTIDYNMDLRSALRNKRFNKNYTNIKNNFNAFKEMKGTVSWEETVKVILPFLRSYATPDAKPDCWYIVPDTHVVVNHSRLLNQMTVLDDKRCRLKIPPIVSMELRNPENYCDEAISRFVRFHCTEIYSESEVKQDVQFRFNNILNTCLQLTMDNYHVVLLCSKLSERLFKYKLNTPVFTVEKLIELENQGRLLPRYSKTVPKQAFNNDTKNDFKDIETTPFHHIADSSAQSSFTRQVLNPESQLKWQTQKENHHETLINNITTEFDDTNAHQLNSKAVASSNNNLCLFKTAKKRIIKLKGICEESLSNSHPSKRKRWSAVKNIHQNPNSTCEESAGKDHEAISTISENADHGSLSKSNVEAIEHEISELSKGNNTAIDESAKNCPLVKTIEKPLNIDIEQLKYYRDKSTSPASFVYTSDIFPDCGFKATDQTEFNSLPVTVYGWLPKFTQILEKVLMEILGQNSTVVVKENSHLQRLRSATLDIIKNFCHCSSIVDAANKLSMKIKQLINSGGEIQSECFFEDIYRYGVNLVELLQEISPSLEYILNAKILLENVRNDSKCSGDSTQNVSDKTDVQQKVLEDNEYMKENDIAADSLITTPECTTIEKNTSNTKINVMCRLSIRNLDQINDQKNVDMVNDQAQHKQSIDYIQNKNNTLSNMDDNKDNVKERNVANIKSIYDVGNTCHENENSFECNAVCETAEQNDLPAEQKSSNITNNPGSKHFEHFIEMFSKEIRKSLMLCANNFKMYITENLDDNDLRPRIQGVQTHLSNMQRELDSILQRESGDINNRFENLLKRAGIDINIDQNMRDEYRNMVHKCRNEVNEFLMSF